jgi:hypothetical protein
MYLYQINKMILHINYFYTIYNYSIKIYERVRIRAQPLTGYFNQHKTSILNNLTQIARMLITEYNNIIINLFHQHYNSIILL